MMNERASISFNNFETFSGSILKGCLNQHDFADVTLVSDDEEQFKVHKVILSAFSSFFRRVLLNNPHSHPLLYLRGVKQTDLECLINFMYLGQAQILHQDLDQFLKLAQELEIAGISNVTTEFNKNIPDDPHKRGCENEIQKKEDFQQDEAEKKPNHPREDGNGYSAK